METDEFVAHAPLDAEVLEAWIEAGWLLPRQDGAKRNFFDVDLARAHLIHDLERLGVNDEGIPVILDLVDQLHGLRRTLRDPPVCDLWTARSDAALDRRRPPRGGARPDGWRGPRRSRIGRTPRTLANSKGKEPGSHVPNAFARYPPLVTWAAAAAKNTMRRAAGGTNSQDDRVRS